MSDIGDWIRRHSPSVPVPAIFYAHHCESPVKSTHEVGQFYHNVFSKLPHPRDRRKKSPSVSAIIRGDQIRRDRRIKFKMHVRIGAIVFVQVLLLPSSLLNRVPKHIWRSDKNAWKIITQSISAPTKIIMALTKILRFLLWPEILERLKLERVYTVQAHGSRAAQMHCMYTAPKQIVQKIISLRILVVSKRLKYLCKAQNT